MQAYFFFTIWAIIEALIKLIKVSIWSDKDCVPGGSDGKESVWNVGDLGSVPGLGKSPRGRNGYPLQYSCLENSMDCIVQGVAKSRTWLSNFHSLEVTEEFSPLLHWKEFFLGHSLSQVKCKCKFHKTKNISTSFIGETELSENCALFSTVDAKSLQSIWLFCDTLVCSPPGSSVHGIL